MGPAAKPLQWFVLGGATIIVVGFGGGFFLLIQLFSQSFREEFPWVLFLPGVITVLLLFGFAFYLLRQTVRNTSISYKIPSDKESQEYPFRRLLESMQIVPWQADIHTWQFCYVGPQAEKLLGYPAPEWLQEGFWMDHIYPPDQASVKERLQHAIDVGESLELEYRMVRKDGQIAWMQTFIAVPKSKSGTDLFRGCLIDITERKIGEEKQRQSEKMQAIGRVASSAAHDFNNILLVVYGYAETLLSHSLLPDTLRPDVEEITRAVDRARILTRQLLAFESPPPQPSRQVQLNQLLQEMERMLRRLLGEKIEFCLHPGQVEGLIQADPLELERAIINLAINAQDAMPNGGRFTIATGEMKLDKETAQEHVELPPGRYVQLTVRDTGIGMNEEVQQKIFEPFYSTKGKEGTGLGLFGVYGTIKKFKGHIQVHSSPGTGTTFEIYFPWLAPEKKSEQEPKTALANGSANHAKNPEATILVVDDEKLVRPVYRRMLEHVGYQVLEAADGPSALEEWQRHSGHIDLVVTDVMMPRVSGFQLARELRQHCPELKILFVSGYADVKEISRREGICTENLLLKPFMPEILVKRVQEILTECPPLP